MPDFLSQLSSFTVFLGISAVGFIFLVVSLLFGEVFDHLGGFDHDLDHGGPSFFSPRVLGVFITAFGGAGALATHYGISVVPSSLIGFAGGAGLASIIYWFAKFLYGQQASTQVENRDMAGQSARVVVSIPANGVGQVRIQLGEELVDKVAKSKTGEAIGEHSAVVIDEVLGEVVVVRPK